MTSFYVGPGRPRLVISTWSDLVAAVQAGATRETHWCELKTDVPSSSPTANTELAKDLASLTVDGGVLLVGVKDNASVASDVVGVDDSTLDGLTSRVDQVTSSRVSPPMHVVIHPIPDPAGSGRSVLVVEVPASPAGPHMVEEKYWGRSAAGKRPLTDDEVARLMKQRVEQDERFTSELDRMSENVDWLPPSERTRGRLYILAQPVSRPSVELTDAAGTQRTVELVLPVLQRSLWANNFEYLTNDVSSPDGFAAATWPPQQWDAAHEDGLTFLQLRDDGMVLFASGDAVRTYGNEGPVCISLAGVCEAVQQVAAVAGHLATEYLQYNGQWRLGMVATGLRSLYPSHHYHRSRGGYGFTPFTNETYRAISVVSLDQLTSSSSSVVESIASRLARGLNLDRITFPYAHVRELEHKLGT